MNTDARTQELLTAAKGRSWPSWSELFTALALAAVWFFVGRKDSGGALGPVSIFFAVLAIGGVAEGRQKRRLDALAKLVEGFVER